MEAACTLAVQTEVLGVALSDHELETLLNKVADGPSISRQASRSKPLVCAVEEWEVLFPLHNLCNLLPLLLRRIDTRRVVRAGVEEDDTALWRRLECRGHTVKVQASGRLGEVRVGLRLKVDIGDDLVVVCPCRIAEVYRLCF